MALAHIRHSIAQIAEAPLTTVQSALKDDKGARALQNACKAALKRGLGGPNKRAASDAASPQPKRTKTDVFMTGPVEMTPQQLEKSLELPLCMDEERISQTVIETNRAPLVLAFAVELLRHTMPEQPLSSRLSLGQAIVSANSRSKAVSLGLDKGPSADEEGYGEGQPRVKVMGREIAVLKRGGYEWKGDEKVGGEEHGTTSNDSDKPAPASTSEAQPAIDSPPAEPQPTWTASAPITLKNSTFIARAHPLTTPSQRKPLMQSLLTSIPHLQTATHNVWAYRVRPPRNAPFLTPVREQCDDDGETGAGDLVLRILRESGTVDTLVVLTRWYGGTMLGPDRWRLMRTCVEGVLGERMRRVGGEVRLGGEALWGLDLEALRGKSTGTATTKGTGTGTGVVGMPIHRPEGARGYLLRSFGSVPAEGEETPPKKAKTQKALEAEREENLGLLLGALRIVFDSWADHLGVAELDRRAWGWYIAVRPDVEGGTAGWGAKGKVRLSDVLKLRRPPGN